MKLSYYIYYRVPAENAKRARATVDVIQKDLSDMTGISGRLLRRRDDETTWMEIYENVASAERFEAERARRFLGRPPARARRAGSRSRGQLAWNNAAGALRRADELPQPGRQKTERPVARRPRERISYRQAAPEEYTRKVEKRAADYNGFSLVVGDAESMFFFSNRGGRATRVEPGVHGLSNHLLDTPWPKVEKAKAGVAKELSKAFDASAMFQLLDDTGQAQNDELPSTGVSLELEERLSAIRILAVGGYGTRCSTVLSFAEDGKVEFHERSYREDGGASGTVSYRFTVPPGKARAPSRRAGSPPPKTPLPAR